MNATAIQRGVRWTSAGAECRLGAEQLARLAAAAGVPFTPPTDGFPTPDAALATLDEELRRFDAARVRLWRAEAGEPNAGLDEAAATFEELGAHPYLARARRHH